MNMDLAACHSYRLEALVFYSSQLVLSFHPHHAPSPLYRLHKKNYTAAPALPFPFSRLPPWPKSIF